MADYEYLPASGTWLYPRRLRLLPLHRQYETLLEAHRPGWPAHAYRGTGDNLAIVGSDMAAGGRGQRFVSTDGGVALLA